MAARLDSGLDLAEAAVAIGITLEHARTWFKVLSQNLDVNSRGDALRLIKALGSALGRNDIDEARGSISRLEGRILLVLD